MPGAPRRDEPDLEEALRQPRGFGISAEALNHLNQVGARPPPGWLGVGPGPGANRAGARWWGRRGGAWALWGQRRQAHVCALGPAAGRASGAALPWGPRLLNEIWAAVPRIGGLRQLCAGVYSVRQRLQRPPPRPRRGGPARP